MIDFNKFDQWIDDHHSEIVQFCCDAISRKSVTGEELPFQKWFKVKCEEAGFDEVDFWAVDEEEKRPNVVSVIKGNGQGENLILNGHSDVVPVNQKEINQWHTNPWHGTIKNNCIFGRGAVDMKGGLTAMYFTALALQKNNVRLKGDLIIESVVGEELCEHHLGTTATVERGYQAPFAIVLEPTDCELNIKSPGAATWELNVLGKAVHNAQANKTKYPQPYGTAVGSEIGVDAFRKALKILDAFENLELQWNLRWRDRILGGGGYPAKDKNGVGLFCIVPAIINAGDYIIAIPGFANIKGGISYAPWIPFDEVEAEMRSVINAVVGCDDWLKENPPEFKFYYDWPGYITEPEHPGCQVLADAYQQTTGKSALFTSFSAVNDASFLYKKGIPAIAFGPGAISNNAHGCNEYIQIEQLILAIKVLVRTVVNWCGVQY